MDAFGSAFVNTADKVLVDLFGDEGNEGSRELCKGDENVVEHVIGALLVLGELGAPVSLTVQTDVPVGELVGELGDSAGGLGDPVGIEIGVYLSGKGAEL